MSRGCSVAYATGAGGLVAKSAGRPAARSADELAALVFERLEQRQSLAEIVIGVRVTPERVRELHEQWSQGLIEHGLAKEVPYGPRDRELMHITPPSSLRGSPSYPRA